MLGPMPGLRRQGGQRRQWLDNLCDWADMSLPQLVRAVEDRVSYRKLVHTAVGKPVVDFIFVIIALFRYLLRLRHYKWKCVGFGVFRRGWVTLSADFTGKGTSPTNQCWCQKTRVIAVSCGFKISAVHHLVLSQYTHLTDGRTDGRTELQ